MVVNQKVTGRASSVPTGLGMGLGLSLGLTVLFSALTAWLWGGEVIDEGAVGYFAMLTLLLSSGAGAWLSWRRIRHRRLLVCGLSAVCYFLSLIGITALFFGGQYSAVGVTGLLILGGAGAVALLGLRGGKSTSVRRRKIRNR